MWPVDIHSNAFKWHVKVLLHFKARGIPGMHISTSYEKHLYLLRIAQREPEIYCCKLMILLRSMSLPSSSPTFSPSSLLSLFVLPTPAAVSSILPSFPLSLSPAIYPRTEVTVGYIQAHCVAASLEMSMSSAFTPDRSRVTKVLTVCGMSTHLL